MKHYAHSVPEKGIECWQLLEDHLQKTAELAANFAANFSAENWGYNAGVLHDLGKNSASFQARIRGKNIRVDHSTPGAKYAETKLRSPPGAGRIIAYCVAGHHAGLPDGNNGDDDSCLLNRLHNCTDSYELFKYKTRDLQPPPFLISKQNHTSNDRRGFAAAFFIRMLYSCLVDADYLDTENFLNPKQSKHRQGYPSLSELTPLFDKFLNTLTTKAPASPVNKLRKKILAECLAAAVKDQGLFSLTVPTGGGKTLSSLAFALKHAKTFGLKRIIYVIPYTSIIEQTAAIFREIFGAEAVLEHHSNLVIETSPRQDDCQEKIQRKKKLATENWDIPIIVTTNVQFFESLFANRSSKCRKIHNISRSVVILDEAQMLPVPFLRPTLEAIRELALNYNTSLVLCTATQPALNARDGFTSGLTGVREIIRNPGELEKKLIRVRTEHLGVCTDQKIVAFLENRNQVLCIVNTKKHARKLFELLKKNEMNFHLSAAMCPVHRSGILNQIRKRLSCGAHCRLISTQLIEAGVDLDFPVVFRALAGLDSIVQAAGRCNREGKLPGRGELFLFEPEEGWPPGYLHQTAQVTRSVLQAESRDILASETTQAYFRELYWLKDLNQGLDSKQILSRLRKSLARGTFPFKTIASEYKIIATGQVPIVIPFDDKAKKLLTGLKDAVLQNWSPVGILRQLQPYSVQIYPGPLMTLLQSGFAELVAEHCYALTSLGKKEAYHEKYGINPAPGEFITTENLII